jgi:hypothetical protein
MDVGLAAGYGTDDGARVEVAYRYRDLFQRGLDLQSSLRISQERQIGYADVYLPPGLWREQALGSIPFKDSVGIARRAQHHREPELNRIAVAGYRHFKLENFETRWACPTRSSAPSPQGADERIKRALAPIIAVTWRHVDNMFDPDARRCPERAVRPRFQGARLGQRLPEGLRAVPVLDSRSARWTSCCCAPRWAQLHRRPHATSPRTSSSAPAARAPIAATRTRAWACRKARPSWAAVSRPPAPSSTCTG